MGALGLQSCAGCASSKKRTPKLKRLVADLSLDKAMLQDVLSKKL
jgi:hypothetical protein